MAQTGFTPILIYSSSTGGNTPAAGNLTNSTLGSELAINITDGKLFYKDNGGSVQVIGWKTTPTTAGGTGLTSYTAGDLLYFATGTTLSKLAIGASTTILTSSGTAPQWSTASGITVGTATNIAGGAAGSVPYQTGAGATSLLAIGTAYYMLGVNAGGTAPSWQPSSTSTLTAQGDLLYASAANTLARLAKNTTASRYLSNSGTSNNPAWAQVDLTNGVTGTLPIGNGGTGATSFTAGRVLYGSFSQSSVFYWDATNTRLGIGTGNPATTIHAAGATTGILTISPQADAGANDTFASIYLRSYMTNYATTSYAAINAYSPGDVNRINLQFQPRDGYNSALPWTALVMNYDKSLTALQTYSVTVGATNRDLYIDNTGLIGYVSSTRESKTNIRLLDDVDWLLQLEPVSFNRKKKKEFFDKDNKPYIEFVDEFYEEEEDGLIADDVEKINSRLCFYDEITNEETGQVTKKLAGIQYSKLPIPLLKLVQKQQAQINELQQQMQQIISQRN